MELPLQGKRAIVGGASQGIGRGCAEALAADGAVVTVLSRSTGALAAVAAELPRPGGQEHGFVAVDFAHLDAVAAAAAAVAAEGPVHILVNNTGGPPPGPLREADPDDLGDAFAMHVLAYQTWVAAVQPGMIAAGYGRIINIISTSVVSPIPGIGVSNTIRAAVANWGRTLAVELGPSGITVNNILPGFIDTDRLRIIDAGRAELSGVTAEELAAARIASIPVGRLGTPADIGAAVAFLASPAASYISGVDLPVDGGRLVSLNR
jgi:3-oxoacyl-[acyl-carrier protein] reductase